MVEGLMNRI